MFIWIVRFLFLFIFLFFVALKLAFLRAIYTETPQSHQKKKQPNVCINIKIRWLLLQFFGVFMSFPSKQIRINDGNFSSRCVWRNLLFNVLSSINLFVYNNQWWLKRMHVTWVISVVFGSIINATTTTKIAVDPIIMISFYTAHYITTYTMDIISCINFALSPCNVVSIYTSSIDCSMCIRLQSCMKSLLLLMLLLLFLWLLLLLLPVVASMT